ncbi:class I SAM-dependent methyltransferase [Lacrimispora sp. JR3]|uniref:class I SAM-dependent methyltransferase n=1 Tax=Lacrimispora sinapis TaxID=3111456 RepID=UPI003747F985
MKLLEENKEYWTSRTMGYSKVNEEELSTEQKNKWLSVLTSHFPGKKENIKVLDMGTGPGFFAIILAQAGFDVTAVDCTASMLERAKMNAGACKDRISWVLSDAHKTDLKEETYDAVVSRNLTWNLEKPELAYKEWLRLLKKGGILLNFDANWYQYLFDETKRQEYEKDRKRVEEMHFQDHYTCTDIDRMEAIAKKLPLSRKQRPEWDVSVLKRYKISSVTTDVHVWKQVWSEEEKANYGSTPMFSILAVK